jgi:Deacetylase PdaC/Protein of unknown function (DUF3298)
MAYGIWHMKKILCLLTLALLVSFLQACKSALAKCDQNAGTPAQNQTSPQPDSQQANEVVVPAPSGFKKVFVGTIDDKHAVRMELQRKNAGLTGGYFYERVAASGEETETLGLKGRIDGDGNVTLTETSNETDNPRKTGEFKGRLEGLNANGDVRLRFSGLWTRGKDGKQMPFSLRELRFDFGGLKLVEKKEKSANKKLRYDIETAAPQLAGANSTQGENFNQAVAKLVVASVTEFKKFAAEARKDGFSEQDFYWDVGYEVTAANKDFISVLFHFSGYTGGAHPNTNTESFNYDLNRGAPVSLADLFTPNSNYLKVISDYAIGKLKKMESAAWAEEGAGPEVKNFHSWNVTPVGLKITFDSYQVGPYVAGPHVVVVPYSVLKPILKSDGPLSEFAK